MKRKGNPKVTLTNKEKEILNDPMLTNSAAALLLDKPIREVDRLRQYIKYRESRKEASRRYRERKRTETNGDRKYDYWSAEEVEYILTSEDSDEEQAKKLGRTVFAIQKKRERAQKKNRRKRWI